MYETLYSKISSQEPKMKLSIQGTKNSKTKKWWYTQALATSGQWFNSIGAPSFRTLEGILIRKPLC